VREEDRQVEFGEACIELGANMTIGMVGFKSDKNTYKGVQRLPRSFACIEAIVDFVCPWSHLHRTDEIWIDFHLRIEARE
jgi:hypothetical protein